MSATHMSQYLQAALAGCISVSQDFTVYQCLSAAVSQRFNVQVHEHPRLEFQRVSISMSQSPGTPESERAVGQGCRCPAIRLSEVPECPNVGVPDFLTVAGTGR